MVTFRPLLRNRTTGDQEAGASEAPDRPTESFGGLPNKRKKHPARTGADRPVKADTEAQGVPAGYCVTHVTRYNRSTRSSGADERLEAVFSAPSGTQKGT